MESMSVIQVKKEENIKVSERSRKLIVMDLFQFQYPMEKMPSRNNKGNVFAAFFHQEFPREVNRAFCKNGRFLD